MISILLHKFVKVIHYRTLLFKTFSTILHWVILTYTIPDDESKLTNNIYSEQINLILSIINQSSTLVQTDDKFRLALVHQGWRLRHGLAIVDWHFVGGLRRDRQTLRVDTEVESGRGVCGCQVWPNAGWTLGQVAQRSPTTGPDSSRSRAVADPRVESACWNWRRIICACQRYSLISKG